MKTAILIASYGGRTEQGRETGPVLFQRELAQRTGLFTVQAFYNRALLREEPQLSLDHQMQCLREAGAGNLIVVPNFLVPGKTWKSFRAGICSKSKESGPIAVRILPAFLEEEKNRQALALAMPGAYCLDAEEGCLCIGHGAGDESDRYYPEMEKLLRAAGFSRLRFALLHGSPRPEDVIGRRDPDWAPGSRIRLIPFLAASGRHMMKDISGEGPDRGGMSGRHTRRGIASGEGAASAAQLLRGAGYEPDVCSCGLLEVPALREVFLRRAEAECSRFNNSFLNN